MPAAAKKPVHEAWSDVMGAVRAIEKGERNKSQGFNFRGVDTVVNVVGPQLREHKVSILPVADEITQTSYQTSKGTAMVNTVVKMRYVIVGPDGSTMEGGAFGEASDAGDKSVSKAESVAYRVFLLQSLAIPTDEADPDAEAHQRAEPAPTPTAEQVETWNALAKHAGALPAPQKAVAKSWATEHLPDKSLSITPETAEQFDGVIDKLADEAKNQSTSQEA